MANSKFAAFFKNNYLLIALVLYGLFIIFAAGPKGFMVDEAIYGQVARESLASGEFWVLRWQDNFWFEKPPLMIWLTVLAFKLRGVSESASHIFPGLFFISSAAIIYALGKNLFQAKLAGFFSAFIFMTTPLIFRYSRANMMDIPAGLFILAGSLAIWKILEGRKKWWLVLGGAAGLAVMAKGVIGFFPWLLLLAAAAIFKKKKILLDRHFLYGGLLFLAIILPWHLSLSLKFGEAFWRDYLGFHVVGRFFRPILLSAWENNSPLAYLELFWEQSGIWIWIWIIMPFVLWSRKAWWQDQKKQWLFLGVWTLIVFLPFQLAATKLPNYMVLACFPLALAGGGFLNYAVKFCQSWLLIFISAVSFGNFLEISRIRALNFANGQFLFQKGTDCLGLGETGIMAAMLFGLTAAGALFFLKRPSYKTVAGTALFLLVGLNLIMPARPVRYPLPAEIGRDLTALSHNERVDLFAIMKDDQYYLHNMAAFYLPIGSKVYDAEEAGVSIRPGTEGGEKYCFIEKSFSRKHIDKAIRSYDEGILTKCAAR